MLDEASATILAAGIPAFVAAATFLVAEVLRARAARAQRMDVALARYAGALQAVPLAESAQIGGRRKARIAVYIELASAATYLLSVSAKRDRSFAMWVLHESNRFTQMPNRDDRVRQSAALTAWIAVWKIKPDNVRQAVKAGRPAYLDHPELDDETPPRASR